MRIGLIADTHVPEAAPELPQSVLNWLADCDHILHCGDLHSLSVVHQLDVIAPTLVSRGNGDPHTAFEGRPGVPEDSRVAETQCLDAGHVRIGMTHDLEHLEHRTDEHASDALEKIFGGRVDIAISGHTHVPSIRGLLDGTLLVNPGSALMPYGYMGILGTIGFLDISEGSVAVTVLDVETGQPQLQLSGLRHHPLTKGPRPTGGR